MILIKVYYVCKDGGNCLCLGLLGPDWPAESVWVCFKGYLDCNTLVYK